MKTVCKGAVIGVANIIPGVSGGTLALVMGIYERMILAIRHVDAVFFHACWRSLRSGRRWQDGLRPALQRIDALFLLQLGVGALAAIALTARLMSYLLEAHHAASYAFFFGLVLLSMVYPYRYLRRRSWREGASFLLAAGMMLALSGAVSEEEQIRKAERKQELKSSVVEERGFISTRVPGAREGVKLAGAAAVAISAMVLPGVSGSFMLLLLGVYFDVLAAVNHREVIVLGLFALGCLFGLAVFSRLMSWLLRRWFNPTMAFMLGLMAGSLWSLWPFKRTVQVGDEILYLANRLPPGSLRETGGVLLAALAGAALVAVFLRLDPPSAMAGGDAVAGSPGANGNRDAR